MTDDGEFIGSYTDWTPYDVPKLAEFLDEDLSAAWGQVACWRQTHEVVFRHRDVLRRTREALAVVWPPERNEAASKFLEVLDQLIASMEEMQNVAVANGTVLKGILGSLDETKSTVDELHEQWQDLKSFEGKKGFQDPNWRVRLNRQAQAQMGTTDQAAIEYYPHLSIPTRYQPPLPTNREQPPTSDGSSDNSTSVRESSRNWHRPPVIPPVSPLAPPDPSVSGPILSGTPGDSVGGGQGVLGSLGGPAALGDVAPAPTASWFVTTPSGRAMRAGGVIGASPVAPDPTAAAVVGQRRGFAASPVQEEASGRAVNPVGGLLGGQTGVGARGDQRRRGWSLPPDTEWEVRKGVPPVLLPPPEPTSHDPGPGVIGIDR